MRARKRTLREAVALRLHFTSLEVFSARTAKRPAIRPQLNPNTVLTRVACVASPLKPPTKRKLKF